ncbi:gamma-glutamylcyclotransferase [Piscirickettsia litoralis]|uniref:gamma-glutamylcyclotransferase n=1 Tax=Piscirickettsia litoralis TaxID=1891921 RepID=UPI0009810245
MLSKYPRSVFWGDLAVFGYGSLLWNPAIEVKVTKPGVLAHFHRRFCLHMTSMRASIETPGLMLALEPKPPMRARERQARGEYSEVGSDF